MSNLEKWINAILNEDAKNLSIGSVRTLQMIRQEMNRLQNEVAAFSSLPVQEGDIVEKMNILADEYVAKQGSHDTPHITKHDFIQGYMAANQSTPSQEGDKALIDAGRLFDKNSTHWADLVGDESGRCIVREKFIKVLEQLRIPDAGMETIIELKKLIERYRTELPDKPTECVNHIYNEINQFLCTTK